MVEVFIFVFPKRSLCVLFQTCYVFRGAPKFGFSPPKRFQTSTGMKCIHFCCYYYCFFSRISETKTTLFTIFRWNHIIIRYCSERKPPVPAVRIWKLNNNHRGSIKYLFSTGALEMLASLVILLKKKNRLKKHSARNPLIYSIYHGAH